ncbi:HypC/HybG/HupF family hydrogenase formation chaperone [Paraferrimonas haliotis]|uniref:Hydrogenase assembly protein HupF n=1 Tax=Paraferrimonas haliotis TaxID=2013866 RepID=A0AA37WY82_9GAMM|nr:HypC/HybG/HupF family hydrogenase formation chaperone [Paraferrimonas haliotis]GLS82806.1 hydrogenase assembly protein HupF [Paraferrimonas haliotis]
MCLGVPAQIIEVVDNELHTLQVSLNGIKREVNGSCVWTENPQALVGRWALIHVGFAMSLLSDDEAQQTLAALAELGASEHEMEDFAGLNQAANIKEMDS